MCGGREEAFELLANDLMQENFLWLMALVLGHAVPGRNRVGASTQKLGPIRPHGASAAWKGRVGKDDGRTLRG
jgi:hypothetical protein